MLRFARIVLPSVLAAVAASIYDPIDTLTMPITRASIQYFDSYKYTHTTLPLSS